ncbi:MAG: tetratricopeptide repeat protein [Candidatus Baltobacteraceae bacterium]
MFDVRRWFAARARRRTGTPFERGVAALEARQPQAALALFIDVLASETEPVARAAAFNKCAVALVTLERREEAYAALCDALREDARCAPALVNLGNLRLEDGDVAGAIERYQMAIRADENYSGAHLNLAIALKRAGRRAESVRHLRIARRLETRRGA